MDQDGQRQIVYALNQLQSIRMKMGQARRRNNKLLYKKLMEEKRDYMNTLRAYGFQPFS